MSSSKPWSRQVFDLVVRGFERHGAIHEHPGSCALDHAKFSALLKDVCPRLRWHAPNIGTVMSQYGRHDGTICTGGFLHLLYRSWQSNTKFTRRFLGSMHSRVHGQEASEAFLSQGLGAGAHTFYRRYDQDANSPFMTLDQCHSSVVRVLLSGVPKSAPPPLQNPWTKTQCKPKPKRKPTPLNPSAPAFVLRGGAKRFEEQPATEKESEELKLMVSTQDQGDSAELRVDDTQEDHDGNDLKLAQELSRSVAPALGPEANVRSVRRGCDSHQAGEMKAGSRRPRIRVSYAIIHRPLALIETLVEIAIVVELIKLYHLMERLHFYLGSMLVRQ